MPAMLDSGVGVIVGVAVGRGVCVAVGVRVGVAVGARVGVGVGEGLSTSQPRADITTTASTIDGNITLRRFIVPAFPSLQKNLNPRC